MKVKYLSINVNDIQKSKKFYQLLNFRIIDEYYSDDISMVTLTDDNIKIELIKDKSNKTGFNNIGLETMNFEENIKFLEKNKIDIDKSLLNSEYKIVSFKDPEDITINLIKKL